MQPNEYKVHHHQILCSALEQFNADFLLENRIAFGGGTRIALELSEYRESVDIDFLCPDKHSYRAVREQVMSNTFGSLVRRDFSYPREIMFGRDKVYTVIDFNNTLIKVEILNCDSYDLQVETGSLFPVPYLSRESCFYTKLLANADRAKMPPYKDIIDLLMMYRCWGDIPESSLDKARCHYGDIALKSLISSLEHIQSHRKLYVDNAVTNLLVDRTLADDLFSDVLVRMLQKYS